MNMLRRFLIANLSAKDRGPARRRRLPRDRHPYLELIIAVENEDKRNSRRSC
jgi:hypothetical protein